MRGFLVPSWYNKITLLTRMNSDHENKYNFISQNLKLKKIMCLFLSDVIWVRYELFDILRLVRGFPGIILKSQNDERAYISHQWCRYDKKNKGTLFSLTLKVQEGIVHWVSWSEFILVSFTNFVISRRYLKTPHK